MQTLYIKEVDNTILIGGLVEEKDIKCKLTFEMKHNTYCIKNIEGDTIDLNLLIRCLIKLDKEIIFDYELLDMKCLLKLKELNLMLNSCNIVTVTYEGVEIRYTLEKDLKYGTIDFCEKLIFVELNKNYIDDYIYTKCKREIEYCTSALCKIFKCNIINKLKPMAIDENMYLVYRNYYKVTHLDSIYNNALINNKNTYIPFCKSVHNNCIDFELSDIVFNKSVKIKTYLLLIERYSSFGYSIKMLEDLLNKTNKNGLYRLYIINPNEYMMEYIDSNDTISFNFSVINKCIMLNKIYDGNENECQNIIKCFNGILEEKLRDYWDKQFEEFEEFEEFEKYIE